MSRSSKPKGNTFLLVVIVCGIGLILGVSYFTVTGRKVSTVFSEVNYGLSGSDGGGSAPQAARNAGSPPEDIMGSGDSARVEIEEMAPAPPSAQFDAESESAAEAGASVEGNDEASMAATPIAMTVAFNQEANRKIIKNADITLEVESVEIALSRVNNAAAQVGGYVLETRSNFGEEGAESAIIQIAVPVDQFEATMNRIREMATKLIDEQASGTDATQEYVDIQSQIANLEATQARIREFMNQATSVDEALRINGQLSQVEAEISQLKGRLQFLSQRAAFSTIAVQLIQQPPQITPTPTDTPTPTATPTPEPVWSPGETAGEAYDTLSAILQVLATMAIWIGVVILPLALPILIAWLIFQAWQRRRNGSSTTDTPSAGAAPIITPVQDPAEGSNR